MSSPLYQKLIQRQTSSHKLSNFGQNKMCTSDNTPRNQMMQIPSHFKPQSSSRVIRIERALTSGDASPQTPQTSQKSMHSPNLKLILEKSIQKLQTMRGTNADESIKNKIALVIHQMAGLCGLKQSANDELWEKLYSQIREEKEQKKKAQTQLNQLIDRQRENIKSLVLFNCIIQVIEMYLLSELMTNIIQYTYQMRKRPSSPYTFLVEFNKRTQIEDGKYKTEYPMYWSQQFQQLTPFKIPKRFEQLHCQRIGVDSISELPQNIQKQEIVAKKEIKIMPKFEQPKRNQFSMSKFQMQQIQSDQVCLGSFNRKNFTLTKILSTLPLEKLGNMYQQKKTDIQHLNFKRKQRTRISPKYNQKYDSLFGQMFGSSVSSKESVSRMTPTIRIKTIS